MTAILVMMFLAVLGVLVTLTMTVRNLSAYRPPADTSLDGSIKVSVCIPARNEADNLRACVESILASDHRNLEVLVYDDGSTDETPEILKSLQAEDKRVRATKTFPLPPGWNGKQHACAQMGFSASGHWLLFTDADVRFTDDAIRRSVAFAIQNRLALASTFPKQITVGPGENLLVPMIFFILFSYLPMRRMRKTLSPAASAGCGQFLLLKAETYRSARGHAAFPASMHDGIEMPRLIRRQGGRTDLFDGTRLVSVRMYEGFANAWRGFTKNAYEGLGSIALLLFLTVFHTLVFLLPLIGLVVGALTRSPEILALATTAIVLAGIQRVVLCHRFEHPLWLVFAHVPAVVLMTAVQWHSFWIAHWGQRSWRGRGDAKHVHELVTLVNDRDEAIGESEKHAAHRNGGQWHRAFSVLLFDDQGRVLLQRRASVKYHFAGLWANACCGHPRPGESAVHAAERRLTEELGVTSKVSSIGSFAYQAADPTSGLTEKEIDHVMVGSCQVIHSPNPLEVDRTRWVLPHELDQLLQDSPEDFSPWLPGVWSHYTKVIRQTEPEAKPVEVDLA